MTKLEKARNQINEIDEAMALLFVKRMIAVKDVIEYKMENNLQIFDEQRELEVIKLNVSKLDNIELQMYYQDFIISLMSISKQYQKNILDKNSD